MDNKIFNRRGKELITLSEAEELGIARAEALKMRILRKGLRGRLKAIKKGKTWFVVKEDVKKQSKN